MLGLNIVFYAVAMVALAPSLQTGKQEYRHLSVPEAEKLVAAWVAKKVKGLENWHKNPPLKDVSTPEIERRLKAQVFRLKGYTDSVSEADAFLIHRGKVYHLCTGFGGSGLDSMCVCDLDGNGTPELAYTYSWGSGMHRSILAILAFDSGVPNPWPSKFVVMNLTCTLVKTSDRDVSVKASDVLFGTLSVLLTKEGNELDVALDKGLSKDMRKLIWK